MTITIQALTELIKSQTERLALLEVEGIVLYGSFGSHGWDHYSDVDLLVIKPVCCGAQRSEVIEQFTFDISVLGLEAARLSLDSRSWRDNVVLLALATGSVLQDSNGHISGLCEKAKSLLSSGTGAPSPDQRVALRNGAVKMLMSVERIAYRGTSRLNSPTASSLLDAKLSSFHVSSSALFSRCCARWAFAPWVTTTLPGDFYKQLNDRHLAIFGENKIQRRAALVAQLLRDALVELDRWDLPNSV